MGATVEIRQVGEAFKVIIHGTFDYERAREIAARVPLASDHRSILPGPPNTVPAGKTRSGEQLYRHKPCGGTATSDVIARGECCADRS